MRINLRTSKKREILTPANAPVGHSISRRLKRLHEDTLACCGNTGIGIDFAQLLAKYINVKVFENLWTRPTIIILTVARSAKLCGPCFASSPRFSRVFLLCRQISFTDARQSKKISSEASLTFSQPNFSNSSQNRSRLNHSKTGFVKHLMKCLESDNRWETVMS